MTNAEADDYWRRKRAAKAMANDGMPRTVEEGIAYGRAWAARNAASRNRMAFDSEREDNMRDDLDPVAVSRCLGHLARVNCHQRILSKPAHCSRVTTPSAQ